MSGGYCIGLASMTVLDDVAAIQRRRGQTQDGLIAELRDRGAPERSQASMSRYLAGSQRVPEDLMRAMREYVSIHAAARDTPAGDSGRTIRMLSLHRGGHDEESSASREANELRRAVLERIGTGPPLSEWDYRALGMISGRPDRNPESGEAGSG